MQNDWKTRKDIVSVARKLYEKGLVAATDGNISVRIQPDRILISSAGRSLGNLTPEDLAYVDLQGNPLQMTQRPSSELPMHLEIYQQRPNINAVIHAHPSYATAITLAGLSLSEPILPEVVVMFGQVPTAAYATPSTIESAEVIRPLIKNHDVILLDHHGAVAFSQDLEDAFNKIEKLEQAAKTIIIARSLGPVKPLNEEQLNRLKNLKDNYKIF
jgi:L-fuculose-phosphate aldolase